MILALNLLPLWKMLIKEKKASVLIQNVLGMDFYKMSKVMGWIVSSQKDTFKSQSLE